MQIKKLATESGKRLNPKAIPSFLGYVRLIKMVSEFSFQHLKCHFFVGSFAKSVYLYVPKNGTWSALAKILRPLL